MQSRFRKSSSRVYCAAPPRSGKADRQRGGDRLLASVVLLTVSVIGEAAVDEPTLLATRSTKVDLDVFRQPIAILPAPFALRTPATASYVLPYGVPYAEPYGVPYGEPYGVPDYSLAAYAMPTPAAAEFRQHGASLSKRAVRAHGDDDGPMLRTTVWQRLSDFRTHGRVRVVTLWETGGNSLSLQAGRRGDPSLQWTSRFMNHGGSSRGLLDQWFSTSLGGIGHGLHLGPHSGGEQGGKLVKVTETAPSNGTR